MKKHTYIHHVDGAHGWIEVPMSEIIRLGIFKDISGYSYASFDGKTAYLEEDCDANRFFRTLNVDPSTLDFVERYVKYPHPIRNLPDFPSNRIRQTPSIDTPFDECTCILVKSFDGSESTINDGCIQHMRSDDEKK